MNKVILIGRLTRDPDVRYTQSAEPKAVAKYTLAVDRRFKDANGERQADFISCTAFGKAAEFVEKYLHKGTKIAVTGHIQTGSYEKDGAKHYTTDVIIEEQEFCESKRQDGEQPGQQGTPADQWANVTDEEMETLPFM
jgi:single-strand DNA-binding protein